MEYEFKLKSEIENSILKSTSIHIKSLEFTITSLPMKFQKFLSQYFDYITDKTNMKKRKIISHTVHNTAMGGKVWKGIQVKPRNPLPSVALRTCTLFLEFLHTFSFSFFSFFEQPTQFTKAKSKKKNGFFLLKI